MPLPRGGAGVAGPCAKSAMPDGSFLSGAVTGPNPGIKVTPAAAASANAPEVWGGFLL